MKKFTKHLFGLALVTNILSANAGVNSVELDINQMSYKRPGSGVGPAGHVNFKEAKMLRDGMILNVRNKDEILNSRIFIRPEFVGIQSSVLGLGFTIKKESALHKVSQIELDKSKFVLNDRFFSFSGNDFQFKVPAANLRLKKFRLYCKGETGMDLTSAVGIEAGCLTNSMLAGINDGVLSDAEIEYHGNDETGELYLSSEVDKLVISAGSINAKTGRNFVKVDNFEIETESSEISCLKDPDMRTLNAEVLASDCMNSASFKSPKLRMIDRKEGTGFFLNIKHIGVQGERMSFIAPAVQMSSMGKSTTLFDLDLDCMKADATNVFDAQGVIGDCLQGGSILVKRIVSEENSLSRKLYDYIFENDIDPTLRHKKMDNDLKNLEIDLTRGKIFVEATFRYLWKDRVIRLWGKIKHTPEENRISVTLDDVKIPWFPDSVSLLLKILEGKLIDSNIKREGKQIHISI